MPFHMKCCEADGLMSALNGNPISSSVPGIFLFCFCKPFGGNSSTGVPREPGLGGLNTEEPAATLSALDQDGSLWRALVCPVGFRNVRVLGRCWIFGASSLVPGKAQVGLSWGPAFPQRSPSGRSDAPNAPFNGFYFRSISTQSLAEP